LEVGGSARRELISLSDPRKKEKSFPNFYR
jgi:hypothetical protein